MHNLISEYMNLLHTVKGMLVSVDATLLKVEPQLIPIHLTYPTQQNISRVVIPSIPLHPFSNICQSSDIFFCTLLFTPTGLNVGSANAQSIVGSSCLFINTCQSKCLSLTDSRHVLLLGNVHVTWFPLTCIYLKQNNGAKQYTLCDTLVIHVS